MGSPKTRAAAAGRVVDAVREGNSVVVVVSAIGRRGDPYATDTLLDLFGCDVTAVEAIPYGAMFASGELIAAALFSHILNLRGVAAQPLTGAQVGILTNSNARDAGVLSVEPSHVLRCLSRRRVPVVAGGQGVCPWTSDITSLGRGGSDTTAVLLAARLDAAVLQLFKDVPGVAAVDPRLVPSAPTFRELSYTRMYEMARWGARVIAPDAIRIAQRSGVPIEVSGLFEEEPGTTVRQEADESEDSAIVSTGPIRSVWRADGSLVGEFGHGEVFASEKHVESACWSDSQVPMVQKTQQEERLCWISILDARGKASADLETRRHYLWEAGVHPRLCDEEQGRQTYVVDARDERRAAETLYSTRDWLATR